MKNILAILLLLSLELLLLENASGDEKWNISINGNIQTKNTSKAVAWGFALERKMFGSLALGFKAANLDREVLFEEEFGVESYSGITVSQKFDIYSNYYLEPSVLLGLGRAVEIDTDTVGDTLTNITEFSFVFGRNFNKPYFIAAGAGLLYVPQFSEFEPNILFEFGVNL